MNSVDALRYMVESSEKSTRQIAREMGRSDSFIRATMAQGTRPRVDTFVAVAHACGYEVWVSSPAGRFELTDAETRIADGDAPEGAVRIDSTDK